jgi:hypothetical protein
LRIDDAREANQSGLVARIDRRIGRAFLLAGSFHIAPTPSPSPVIKGLAKVQKGKGKKRRKHKQGHEKYEEPTT